MASLTLLRQDGGVVNGDILEDHGCLLHHCAQAPDQGSPGQRQVARGGVQNTAINAVALQIGVWRLRVQICLKGEKPHIFQCFKR